MTDTRRWPIARYLAEGPAHSSVSVGRLTSRWMEVGGQRMHARCSNIDVPDAAPDVVLVHGIGVSSLYMVPTARMLAKECRVYAPDLPGFGHSDHPERTLDIEGLADALAAWMRAVGLERAVLVGNSMGCQTIVACALRHPELVDRLVLQGPTIDPEARTCLQQVARWIRNMPRDPPSESLILLRDWLKCGPRRFFETLSYGLDDRIEQKLPRVRQPAMVVRGMRDPIVPERWAREVTELLPDGRLRQIPGAAHTLNFATPLEFVRVMRPFLFGSAHEDSASQTARRG